jgi:hypothetical protein
MSRAAIAVATLMFAPYQLALAYPAWSWAFAALGHSDVVSVCFDIISPSDAGREDHDQ